jgi:hypothetical protein
MPSGTGASWARNVRLSLIALQAAGERKGRVFPGKVEQVRYGPIFPGPGPVTASRFSRKSFPTAKRRSTNMLSFPPGKGYAIESVKDGKFVAECKGGIVNTTHA